MFGKNRKKEESIDSEKLMQQMEFLEEQERNDSEEFNNINQEEQDDLERQIAIDNDDIKNYTETYKSRYSNKEIFDLLNSTQDDSENDGNVYSEYVELEDIDSDDFVIIGGNSSKIKILLNIIKIIVYIILIIAVGGFVLFGSLYKLLPEDVKGSIYSFEFDGDNYSIISRNHQPNMDELKSGDVFFIDSSNKFSPYMYEYDIYTFKSRNGAILYALDNHGKSVKIQSVNVSYIRKEPVN